MAEHGEELPDWLSEVVSTYEKVSVVKAKTGNETDSTVYADWYKAVYMPTLTGVNTSEE